MAIHFVALVSQRLHQCELRKHKQDAWVFANILAFSLGSRRTADWNALEFKKGYMVGITWLPHTRRRSRQARSGWWWKALLCRIFISRIVAFYLTIFKLVYFLSLEHWFADTTLYVPFFYRMSRYYSSHAFYVFVVGKLHVCAGQNLAFYYWPRAKVVQLRVCNFSCQTMPKYTKTRYHHKYRQRN